MDFEQLLGWVLLFSWEDLYLQLLTHCISVDNRKGINYDISQDKFCI